MLLSLKNSVARKKIFTILATPVAFIILFAGLAIGVATYFKSAVDMMSYANKIDSAIAEQQIYAWRFLFGDKDAAGRYEYAHQKVVDNGQLLGSGAKFDPLRAIIEQEQSAYDILTNTGDQDSFFNILNSARGGFNAKNNGRMVRILGYIKNWAPPETRNNTKAFSILDGIRNERILLGEFDVKEDGTKKIDELQETNSRVVKEVKELIAYDIDFALARSKTALFSRQMSAVKSITENITPSSFPVISSEDATLLRVDANATVIEGIDSASATEAFFEGVERILTEYERKSGVALWNREDIYAPNENATPVLTLGKIIALEQDLRVGAGLILEWQGIYFTKVDPVLSLAREDLRKFREETALFVNTFSVATQVIIIVFSAIVIGVMFILAFSMFQLVVLPLVAIRDAINEVGKGNFKKRVKVSSVDEIGQLAVSFNTMAEHLEYREDALRGEIKKHAHELEDTRGSVEREVNTRTSAMQEKIHELTLVNQAMMDRENNLANTEAGPLGIKRKASL